MCLWGLFATYRVKLYGVFRMVVSCVCCYVFVLFVCDVLCDVVGSVFVCSRVCSLMCLRG